MRNKIRSNYFKRNIKSKCYAMLLAILASITLLACQQTDAVQEKMNLATQYMSEGNYEQAIVMYREVLDTEPENVEAYLGIADAYEAMEDYETGLTVLEEAYEVTGEETLVQEIQDVEELHVAQQEALQAEVEKEEEKEAWELGPNPIGGTETIELEPVIPECVVDNVKHPAYYEFDFTDEQKAYLDNLIELTESGQYEQAIAALDEATIKTMSNIEGNKDGSDYGCYWINCVYKDRKIHLAFLPYSTKFIIVPMNEGNGYGIQKGTNVSYSYLKGSCSGGYFNGSFECYSVDDIGGGETREYQTTGNTVNNILNGEVVSFDLEYKTKYIRNYNMGKIVYWDLKQVGADTSYIEGQIVYSDGRMEDLFSGGINDTIQQTTTYFETTFCAIDYPLAHNFYVLQADGTYKGDW